MGINENCRTWAINVQGRGTAVPVLRYWGPGSKTVGKGKHGEAKEFSRYAFIYPFALSQLSEMA